MSEHTDAARLEALRDSMRPRVEGEAVMTAAEARGIAARMVSQGFSRNAGEWDRAAVSLDRLTAEVARLRGVVKAAYREGVEDGGRGWSGWRSSEAFAALALPTNAEPEVKNDQS